MNFGETKVLTEHFQYPPIALIDDVINAVDILLYKAVDGVEKFLVKWNETNQLDLEAEILDGTAKFENLLESCVDYQFDKLEVYSLRNIINIPRNLLDKGYIRLNHQRGLDYRSADDKRDTELEPELIAARERFIKASERRKLLEERLKVVTAQRVQVKEALQRLQTEVETPLEKHSISSLKDIVLDIVIGSRSILELLVEQRSEKPIEGIPPPNDNVDQIVQRSLNR
ncbi:hypothetical protein CANCADRAFT_32370 [Tortispora caseinolytica NRRL Y-17796]|uniref:Uncharacterized protein n=1 Tax=Tortispora caseinolytica NRRL Y-17796 TaxID=767744 RepID=A0A1E4TB74_9ASCO|nr:hypothetical protein CANCADRAFT_32370 [Tortispora caseinolytica NRRL Y-17796]